MKKTRPPTAPLSGEDFRILFESSPSATLVLDPSFRIITASDLYLKLTMNRREDIVGRDMFEVFPENPDDPAGRGQAALRDSLERVVKELKSDRMTPLRYDIPRPEARGGDFVKRWWSPVNVPVFGGDGGLRAIIHCVEDITRAREAEIEKEVQVGKYEASVKRFRALIRATQDAIWDWDLEADSIHWNENILVSFGHDPESMAAIEAWFAAIHPEDRDRVEQSVNRSIEGSEPGQWEEEYRFMRGDGSVAHVFDRGLVMRDETGKGVRMIGSMQDITKRVQTVQELQRVREQMEEALRENRRILENSLDIFATLDEDGVYTKVSGAVRRILGYEPSEMEGRHFFDFVHPDDVEPSMETWASVKGGMPVSTFRNRAIRKDGTAVPLMWSSVWMPEEESAYSVARDVTKIAEAEREIARLGEHQRALAELAEFAISEGKLYAVMAEAARRVSEMLDIDFVRVLESVPGEEVLVVRAVAGLPDKLLGTSRVTEGGRSPAGVAFQSDSTVRIPDFAAEQGFDAPQFRGGGARSGIAVVIEGVERPWGVLEADSREPRKFTDADAAFLETVANVLGQAVERDASERQLRYQATLLDAVGESIMALEPDGRIVYWNRHAELLHGWNAGEALGRNALELLVPHEERERAFAAVAEVLGGREWAGDMSLSRKNRDPFAARLSVVPVTDQHGEISGMIVASIDLTDRIQLEEQLRQAQKMEAVGRLAGGIAHDFNNLLTVIAGHAELLESDVAEGTPAGESVAQIADAAARAGNFTRQLLAFSRQQVLQPQVLVLAETVRRMEKILRRVIGEDVRLELTETDPAVSIVADPTQIEQVVLNLAVNARDAMPLGGTLTISVECRRLDRPLSLGPNDLPPGSYAVLSVQDTGSGIPPEAAPYVFDPFFTTKEQGKGTGLGLATVFGIVQQSGGGIHVDSLAGVGTTISIYFPEGEAGVAVAGKLESKDEVGRFLEGRTLLVVEDDPSVRTLLARFLPKWGARVLQAENGVHALRVIEEFEGEIDIVLTDLVMPEVGGAELANRLKREHPELPILFMSGYSSELVADSGVLEEGVLLRKPFTSKELAQHLRAALKEGIGGERVE